MSKVTLPAIIVAAAVAAGVLAPTSTRAGIFDDVELQSLPAAVQKTITAQLEGGKLRKIERETEDGSAYYEVDITKDGKRMEFKVDEAGRLLVPPADTATRVKQKIADKTVGKIGNDVTLEQLSTQAQQTVKKETAGGKITEIEQDKEDAIIFYEVEFEKDGEEYEIRVDQSGKVVKRDD